MEGFSGGDRMVFYLVSDSTTDAVLSGETSADQVLLGTTFDSDAFEPLRITSETNNLFLQEFWKTQRYAEVNAKFRGGEVLFFLFFKYRYLIIIRTYATGTLQKNVPVA